MQVFMACHGPQYDFKRLVNGFISGDERERRRGDGSGSTRWWAESVPMFLFARLESGFNLCETPDFGRKTRTFS